MSGEGEAVRGVVSRNPYSEWILARQKTKPKTLFRKIVRESVTERNNWIDVWNPARGYVTFFFTNFPPDCSSEELCGRFNEIGNVRDLFIPTKLDKVGRKYGFVRFGENINNVQMEIDLNNIWLGSYKLQANISKFTRKSSQKPYGTDNVEKTGISKTVILKAVDRVEGKTYAQAVQTNPRMATPLWYQKRLKGNLQASNITPRRRIEVSIIGVSHAN
ncbi:hypothetical protein ACS0TY_026174 [Phlomoides rotata]